MHRYVTCSGDTSELGDLINLQTHKCAKTCKKKTKNFSFPLYPLPKTLILPPLDQVGLDTSELNSMKENLRNIKKLPDSMKYGLDISRISGEPTDNRRWLLDLG